MTRFWITLDRGVSLVLRALEEAQGGEVFVPKIPSMSVSGLLAAMPVECSPRLIGRRPGEKLHEVLIGENEGVRTLDCGDYFVVLPDSPDYRPGPWAEGAHPAPPGFSYASDTNTDWVSLEEMRTLIVSMSGKGGG
jgi:UDP-N-acetylglucosamine 4,6-dehydratase